MSDQFARFRGWLFVQTSTWFGRRVSVGKDLRLYCRLSVTGGGKVVIGNDCTIAAMPGKKVDYVTLCTEGPDAVITVGDGARLYAARLSCKYGISIGAGTRIEESSIADSDFHSLTPDRASPAEEHDKCVVTIGQRVSIGARSVIGKGVAIGDDAVVLPGSIVIRSIPAGKTVCGNPARLV